MRKIIIFFFCFAIIKANAQLCQGSLGDPIVNITFGAGANPGPALSAATTAYNYWTSDCPNDGLYAVRNSTQNCFSNSWYSLTQDHTGDANGYFMLVNASYQPSDFYVDTVRGLCSNTTFEFATWIMNMMLPTACGGNGIQPNITFSIEKTDGTVLGTSNTGNIATTAGALWKQYGFYFTTPPGVSDIVLRMKNNANGGCGNDLALDDITFRACGPNMTPTIIGIPTTSVTICQGVANTYNFTCTLSSGLPNPGYQWQQSINGSAFTDMPGQNTLTLSRPVLVNEPIGVYQYRLSVADAANLSSMQCRTNSLPITLNIIPNVLPTTTTNNGPICAKSPLLLQVNGGTIFSWTGPNNFSSNVSNPTINNSVVANSGKYYVQVSNTEGCKNLDSTFVVINPSPTASTAFVDTNICKGQSVVLSASGGGTYQWTPTTNLINFSSASPIASPTDSIKYKVIVSNQYNCIDSASTKINVLSLPKANAGKSQTIVANQNIQLNGNVSGTYSSLFWSPPLYISNTQILNPVVNPPSGMEYYLTAANACGSSTDSVAINIFNGLFIPNVFTPNGDGKNDTWVIPPILAYPNYQLKVFNRFGQIVFRGSAAYNNWDGIFNGIPQPEGAYTYMIDLKDGSPIIKGSVLILR